MASNITRLNTYKKKEQFSCKASVVATDIVVYVPGTTDPFNVKDTILESNKSYWKENIHFQGLFYDFKAKFCEMHINKDFKWTGDNNVKERKKAGKNLFDFLLRYYKNHLNRKVSLHFIGHSHGGLVINECLQHFKKNKAFPKKYWKVKSITYLSTPFFKKEHLPDITYFHKDCKIFAVNNKYDLTQRFIADFSMYQLPLLIKTFADDPAISIQMKKIKAITNHESFKYFSDRFMEEKYIRPLFQRTILLVPEIQKLFSAIILLFQNLKSKTLSDEIIDQFIVFFTNLNNTLNQSVAALNVRLNDYMLSRNDYFIDLNLRTSLRLLADLLDINTKTYASRLLLFIDKMLVNQIDEYHNTVVEPPYTDYKPYYSKPIQVDKTDPYHPVKEKEFDQFIKEIERLETVYEGKQTSKIRAEIILRLISPMRFHPLLEFIAKKLNTLDYIIRHDETEEQIKRLILALKNNVTVLKSFYINMIHPKDVTLPVKDAPPAFYVKPSQRGSIIYLAFISHSISRMNLDPRLEKQLESQFDSTKNPGYKGKTDTEKQNRYKVEIMRKP